VRLVSLDNIPLWLFVVDLKVFLQEIVFQKFGQLVAQGHAPLYIVPEPLVEFTPNILSFPQISINLLGEPQLFGHYGYAYQFLVRYAEVWTKILFFASCLKLPFL